MSNQGFSVSVTLQCQPGQLQVTIQNPDPQQEGPVWPSPQGLGQQGYDAPFQGHFDSSHGGYPTTHNPQFPPPPPYQQQDTAPFQQQFPNAQQHHGGQPWAGQPWAPPQPAAPPAEILDNYGGYHDMKPTTNYYREPSRQPRRAVKNFDIYRDCIFEVTPDSVFQPPPKPVNFNRPNPYIGATHKEGEQMCDAHWLCGVYHVKPLCRTCGEEWSSPTTEQTRWMVRCRYTGPVPCGHPQRRCTLTHNHPEQINMPCPKDCPARKHKHRVGKPCFVNCDCPRPSCPASFHSDEQLWKCTCTFPGWGCTPHLWGREVVYDQGGECNGCTEKRVLAEHKALMSGQQQGRSTAHIPSSHTMVRKALGYVRKCDNCVEGHTQQNQPEFPCSCRYIPGTRDQEFSLFVQLHRSALESVWHRYSWLVLEPLDKAKAWEAFVYSDFSGPPPYGDYPEWWTPNASLEMLQERARQSVADWRTVVEPNAKSCVANVTAWRSSQFQSMREATQHANMLRGMEVVAKANHAAWLRAEIAAAEGEEGGEALVQYQMAAAEEAWQQEQITALEDFEGEEWRREQIVEAEGPQSLSPVGSDSDDRNGRSVTPSSSSSSTPPPPSVDEEGHTSEDDGGIALTSTRATSWATTVDDPVVEPPLAGTACESFEEKIRRMLTSPSPYASAQDVSSPRQYAHSAPDLNSTHPDSHSAEATSPLSPALSQKTA